MLKIYKYPSNRSFGFLFTAIFAFLCIYGWYRGTSVVAVYGWLGVALLISLITFFAPRILTPFNKAWFHLGLVLGRVVSPIVLGAIFFCLLTPVGLIGRMLGRDELRLKRTPANSYLIDRDPPGLVSDSFKNQF